MLIALYDGVIQQLERGIEAIEAGDASVEVDSKLRSAALIEMIESGLDDQNEDATELVDSIRKLCDYSRLCIKEGTADHLRSAALVLSNLRDGYVGIRDEANELENTGVIPPLEMRKEMNTVV